ncbi:hypothetical protein HK107_03275 [Parvularcula sp. ZS-1/3]|uniref:Uncharacterized protein n=1 Tax=Parvularcula mediterranea TaxID=2732508 RepID=A0A7Y3RJQ8_9PROT|nr:hypothetical protein [Parvularcula mediterranea]NNU15347.1 hypothetical protein [Parvularcula mediterranea]
MKRIIMLVLGLILSMIGVLLTISPFPMGFVLVFFGFGILIMHSPRFAAWVRLNRTNNDVIDRQASVAAKACPPTIAEALEKTSPHRNYEDEPEV